MIKFPFEFSFFNKEFISNYLIEGFYFSLSVTLISTFGGLILGTLLAMSRTSKIKAFSSIASLYILLMRSIPLVLVIMWFFLIVPALIGKPISQISAAYITFIAFEAAYFAEIIRAGIQSIKPEQAKAASALGMRYLETMKCIILPQAFRNILPMLLTQIIILFQDTSLVYVIGGYDLLKSFDIGGNIWQRKPESYILAAMTYFFICSLLSSLVKRIQHAPYSPLL
ncbi:MAG: glutamate/aspartate transport system permease protein [Candidatus Tokpelaia sp. JSC161]|jgi:glutamate/aspartate transport system permease protein|nr:MAG: glutamate/aspartate transport system permease protein [Candidatus Tokpelaia sp. JSC161]